MKIDILNKTKREIDVEVIEELGYLLKSAYLGNIKFTDSFLKETLETVIVKDECMAEIYDRAGGFQEDFAEALNTLFKFCNLKYVVCQVRDIRVKDLTTIIEHNWIIGKTIRDYEDDIEYEFMDEE